VHPIAFHFDRFTIYWYGIFTALGFLAGFWTASRRAVRDGLKADDIMDSAIWILIGTVVGARSLHVISYWHEQYAGQPWKEIFMIQKGGLVYYGGLMGASAAAILYTRIRHMPLWKYADALAPSVALGHAFGRVGCLMTGCCFGKECHLPWAISFPPQHETHGIPVHPTQIYESLLNFCLYLFLAWAYRRKKFDGQIFAAYLMIYAVVRSFVELFRGDYKPQEFAFHILAPGQVVSIFVFVIGGVLFWIFSRDQSAAKQTGHG
jgi:phosphatidylglycerol:prolipoprotein diacylglycerol transferase